MQDRLVDGGGRRGLIALSITGVLWGSIGIAVRLQQDVGVATTAVAFWRFLSAGFVLLIVMGPSGLRSLRPHLRRPGRLAVVSVGSMAFQLLYAFAVKDVGVAVATLITLGLAPVALVTVESTIARAMPTPKTTGVLLCALVGLALVTSSGGSTATVAPHAVRGLIEAVASGLFYAASTRLSGRLSNQLRPVAITFAASAVAVIALAPVLAITSWQVPTSTTAAVGSIWLGVVTTVVAYGLFYAALRTTPGHIALVLTLLEPVTAVVLAAVVLDEPLTLVNVIGGALLIAAVAVLYLSPKAPPEVDKVTEISIR